MIKSLLSRPISSRAKAVLTNFGYNFTTTEPQGALQLLTSSGKELRSKLLAKKQINHDTYIYTFDIPMPNTPLGFITGENVGIGLKVPDSKNPGQTVEMTKKYNPISDNMQIGSFDVLIKIYRKNVNPNFPEGGFFSQQLEALQVGDLVKITGPSGILKYHENGNVMLRNEMKKFKTFGFIAAGTGITPSFPIMDKIFRNKDDPTQIHLLSLNKTTNDILLKEYLDKFAQDSRFKVYYAIDKSEPGWQGFIGYINEKMIEQTMPTPADDVAIGYSGPKPFNQYLAKTLKEMGYKETHYFKF